MIQQCTSCIGMHNRNTDKNKSMASNIDDGTKDEETATKSCKNISCKNIETKSRLQQWTRGTCWRRWTQYSNVATLSYIQVCVTIMIYSYIANFIASYTSALAAKFNHACNIMEAM